MNVLHLATFDAHGGAAVAALGLVDGLRRQGHDARLLVRDRATAHPYVDALARDGAAPASRTDPAVAHLTWLFTQKGRSTRSDTPYSSDLPTLDVANHAAVRAADVLHLHWVNGFLSAFEIRRLQDLGKPIVWTLHDQFPFTGGCHYSQTCRAYTTSCARCPQLQPAAQAVARLTLAQKRDFIDPARLVLAAPSRWLAQCARQSALFRNARIEVVPYGIDVASRRRVPPDAARRTLGIPEHAVVVFTSSLNHQERRKGAAHLVEALRLVHASRARRTGGRNPDVLVLTAGAGAVDGAGGFAGKALGALPADDPRLRMAYRAADLFVLPSLEDNLPVTLLEAMAAGLPVVAFHTGGIPEVLQDDVNGRLVKRGDTRALAATLAGLLDDTAARQRLGDAAALSARASFDWPIQVAAYERMYADEAARRAGKTRRRSAARLAASQSKGPIADAPRLQPLLGDRAAMRLFNTLLRQQVDEIVPVVHARGGEIRDLRAALAHREAKTLREMTELQNTIDTRTTELREAITARSDELRDLRHALADAHEAGARRKAVIAQLLRARAPDGSRRPRLGIFGAGDNGRRVFEAAILLDYDVAWFADNDPALRGSLGLRCDVIAPAVIPRAMVDAIVIASSRGGEVRAELVALGVVPGAILTPDLSRGDAELLEELRRLLEARRG